MTEELVLSASSVDSYEQCHWRWYLQYVELHEGAASIPTAVGNAVHAGAQHFYEGVLEHREVPHAEVLDVADLRFLLEIESIVDAEEDPLKYRPITARCMTTYLEDVAEKVWGQVISTETAITTVVDGIAFSGHPDQLEDGVVADTKVVKQPARFWDKYLFQMTGGAVLYEAVMGDAPADRRVDQIIRLKRDRPRYVPIHYGETTVRQMDEFRRGLNDVAEGIARGDYTPTGLATGACRYCPVRFICSYYGG